MISSFIFVRHGQSQANADGIIANDNSPLTQTGTRQAQETGLKIKDLGITTIVCSPALRARQTAETIAGELGIDPASIKTIDELKERDLGDYKGGPKTQPSEWYSQDEAPTLEPRQALLDRMGVALDKIKAIDTTGVVLVVGHAVSGFFLVNATAGVKTLTEMGTHNQIGNADFVKIEIK
jgi:broad specificity phosphatase PhoE